MTLQTPVKPRKRPRQERAVATLDAILEATAPVMVEFGYDKASTNRIAKRAGVSIGSLYQYFPNKEAIIFEMQQRHSSEMLGLLGEMAADLGAAPVEDAVRAFVRTMFAAHASNPSLHRALVQQVMHVGFDKLRDLQQQAIRLVRAYLEANSERLVPQNLDMAAHVLVTTVDSLTHAAVLEEPILLTDPAYEAEVVDLVVRYLLGT